MRGYLLHGRGVLLHTGVQKTSRIFTLHQTTTKEHVFKYHLMVKIETKAILKRRQKKIIFIHANKKPSEI
jgi:hypothetical protein